MRAKLLKKPENKRQTRQLKKPNTKHTTKNTLTKQHLQYRNILLFDWRNKTSAPRFKKTKTTKHKIQNTKYTEHHHL